MKSISEFLLSNSEKYTKSQYNTLLELSKNISTNENSEFIEDLENSMNSFKDVPNMILDKNSLSKLIPNFNLDSHKNYLSLMGIQEIPFGDKSMFSLNIYNFINSAILNASQKTSFKDKVDLAYNLFDTNSKGSFGIEEIQEMIKFSNEVNSLSFDSNMVSLISQVIFEALDKEKTGIITKDNLRDFLENFKNKKLKLNAFSKDRAKSFKKYL